MKLTDNKKATKAEYKITFENIHDGEIFYADELIYMKLAEDVQIVDSCSPIYNAVSLNNGALVSFADDETVGCFTEEPNLIYDSYTVRYTQ